MDAGLMPRDTRRLTLWELNQLTLSRNRSYEAEVTANWQLGQLIGTAVNAPKDYPKLSKLLPKKTATYDKQKMKQEAAGHGLRVP